MGRPELLDKLNKVTDRAATVAMQKGYPLVINKNSTLIGNLIIEKNDFKLYNIIAPSKKILFNNISVFDVAVIVAQRYNQGEMGTIKQVLLLEERFSKYHIDMVHYLDCIKTAKKKNDFERIAILEDKFYLAELMAKSVRDKLAIFKKVK